MPRTLPILLAFVTMSAHAAWPSLERIVESTFDTEPTPARELRAHAYARLHELPLTPGTSAWLGFPGDTRFQLARQEAYDDLIAERVHEMWEREPGRTGRLTSWQEHEVNLLVAALVGADSPRVAKDLRWRLSEIGRNVPTVDDSEFEAEMDLHGEMLARTIERLVEAEDFATKQARVIDAIKIVTHARLMTGARGPRALASVRDWWRGVKTENVGNDAFWSAARRAIRQIRRGDMMTEYDAHTFEVDGEPMSADDPAVTARRVLAKLAEWTGAPDLTKSCEVALATTPAPLLW